MKGQKQARLANFVNLLSSVFVNTSRLLLVAKCRKCGALKKPKKPHESNVKFLRALVKLDLPQIVSFQSSQELAAMSIFAKTSSRVE